MGEQGTIVATEDGYVAVSSETTVPSVQSEGTDVVGAHGSRTNKLDVLLGEPAGWGEEDLLLVVSLDFGLLDVVSLDFDLRLSVFRNPSNIVLLGFGEVVESTTGEEKVRGFASLLRNFLVCDGELAHGCSLLLSPGCSVTVCGSGPGTDLHRSSLD